MTVNSNENVVVDEDMKMKLPTGKIITFNHEQYEGIKKIRKWLKNDNIFFVLSGYAGTGKAQAVDCKVYTPMGPVNIGDLKVGDEIFSPKGNIIKVNGVFPQGVKQAYKISFRDKSFTECNEEHLWNVWTKKLRQNNRPCKTMTLREIMDSGLTRGIKKKLYNYSIPLCQPVQYPKKELPIHPHLLGVLIGDGGLSGNVITLSCPDIDSEIIDQIKDHIPNYITLKRDDYSACPRYSFTINDNCYKNKFKEKIVKLGLNVKSEFKFIPDIYKYSSIEQRWELLKGLMDTDGTSRGNRIEFSTSSKQLRDDVIELVQSLGGVAILRKNDERSENINYTLNVKTFENPFKLKRKANNWKFSSKNPPSRYITSIEKSRVCEQVCISVDSPDGLYLTDNYIVTHNTTIIKKILDENRRKRIVVSAPTHKAKKVIMRTTEQEGETLQSLLGLRPDVNLDDFNPNNPQFNQIAEAKMPRYNFIIIDEASMVNEDLFEMIKIEAGNNFNTKILFMGDPAQTPPVHEKESIVFFEDSGILDRHHLTQVMRQEDGNPLAVVYDNLRNNLTDLYGGIERKSAINSKGEGIIFTNKNKEFREKLKEIFITPEYRNNPEYGKLIAWRNTTVMESNKIIREFMFGKGVPMLMVNDVLMAYRSVRDAKQFYNIIDNSEDYRVMNVSERYENEYKMWGYKVNLRETLINGKYKYQKVFILDHLDHNNLHHYAEMHDFLRDMGLMNKSKWRDYYNFRRNNLIMTKIDEYKDGSVRPSKEVIAKDLDYGYAITGHKCLSENSWVLTDKGNIKLKDIKIGDYVSIGMGSGIYKKVINKFDSGIKKSFELTTKSGYKIRCSEDHRILNSHHNFKSLKEFKVGDFIPINRSEFRKHISHSKDINYFLGLLVADGSYSGNRKRDPYRIDLTIGLDDKENIDFIEKFYRENNVKFGIGRKKKSNCVQFYNSGKVWRTKLHELGLNYVKCKEKSTPISILNGTYQMKSNFIAGLFDGDGHISKRGRILLTNNSKKLLLEVQGMLLEFGIISYIRKEKKSYRLIIVGTSINKFKKLISFRLTRKQNVLDRFSPTIKTNLDFIPHKEEIFDLIKSDLTQDGFYVKNKGLNPADFKRFPNHIKYLSYENLSDIIQLYKFNNHSLNKRIVKIFETYYYYDEITSIEPIGKEQMYDLEIEDIHQYVANGFIVHNSQGSTYEHVLVLENDIDLNPKIKEKNQIKYVALTRPTKTATVFTRLAEN